jgi:integrase
MVELNGRPFDSGVARYWVAARWPGASWCINRRVDGGLELPLKVVQARLGHASIQMTADRGLGLPRTFDL